MLEDPEALLEEKVSERLALQENTRLSLPGDERIVDGIDWSKQNLADSVQVARDLEIRETNAGKNYPAPEGELAQMRFLGAGFPDYQWLFGTDGEYTAFASVGVGQFEPIKDHLRALKQVSLIDNGNSGKVVHEVVTDGTVYFGSNADAGNTDETAKFPSAVALIWRWTGDNAFRDEMYAFSRSNMEYIFRELDEDGDGWPEGLGNVERAGMGEEKLDNTVYTIRGLYDLADMARSKGDVKTAAWAQKKARGMESKFEAAWWFGQEGVTQYADSLDPSPVGGENTKIFQRHWIGATPMEAELVNVTGNHSEPVPGLASQEHGQAALGEREEPCYTDTFGMYHTGTGPTRRGRHGDRAVLRHARVGGAGGAGDLHPEHRDHGRRRRQLRPAWPRPAAALHVRQRGPAARLARRATPDEQPARCRRLRRRRTTDAPSNRPFNERAMVLQAWGAYGTIWPVVHQWLGVRPDLGRRALEVVPQVPPDSPEISGENIRLGNGSVAVSADATGDTYTTTVGPDVALRELLVGHTVPADKEIASVTLDRAPVADYRVRSTNRGKEVLVKAAPDGEHTLVVVTR